MGKPPFDLSPSFTLITPTLKIGTIFAEKHGDALADDEDKLCIEIELRI